MRTSIVFLVGAVACASAASGQIPAGTISAVARAVTSGDEPAIRKLVNGAVQIMPDRGYQNLQPADLVRRFSGCLIGNINERVFSQYPRSSEINDPTAVLTCGSACDAPAYSLRVHRASAGYTLIVGRRGPNPFACGARPPKAAPPALPRPTERH